MILKLNLMQEQDALLTSKMKTLKILSILVFAVFLVSTVAAFGDVYGEWTDQSQSMSIVEGESVDFNFDFFSMDAPITININLYDSQFNLVYSFEDNTVITNPCTQGGEPISGTACYTGQETIDPSVYSTSGFYELIMTYSDADDYSTSHSLSLSVTAISDTNIPVITLLGDNPVTIVKDTTYTDAGATASDIEDGDLTASIVVTGSVDTSTLGTYALTYNVQDAAGNFAAPVTRTVSVVEEIILDTNIPVITLLGDNPVTIVKDTTYTDAGATASDIEDGDLTASIVVTGSVDTSTLGTYVLTYNVQDAAGNFAAPVTRTVSVVEEIILDTISPVITLLGNNPESVALGDTYADAGATALDNIDGDITANIIIANPVDPSIVGVYTITYNVQDNAENDAIEVTRTVNVFDPNDTTAPVITVITPEEDKEYDDSELTFEVEVNEVAEVKFSLNGGSEITMDYQGMSNGILTFVYDVNLDDGNHEITFYATDAAGNTANVIVEFSVDTSTTNDKDDESYTNYYQSNYEEQLYLDQFKPSKIIYLDADDQPGDKDLNFWQRFIEWLKDLFGF